LNAADYRAGYLAAVEDIRRMIKAEYRRPQEIQNTLFSFANRELVEWSTGDPPRFELLPWRIVRRLVFIRDGRFCAKCGATKYLHVDHIIPVSKGGTAELSNLRVLCRDHNLKRRHA